MGEFELQVIQRENTLFIKINKEQYNITRLILRKDKENIYFYQYNGEFRIDLKKVNLHFNKKIEEKVEFLIEYYLKDERCLRIKKINIKEFKTQIRGLEKVDFSDFGFLLPYISLMGALNISLNKEIPLKTYYVRRHISEIKMKTRSVHVSGRFSVRTFKVSKATVEIRARNEGTNTFQEVELNLYKTNNKKLVYSYDYSVDLYEALSRFMHKHSLEEDIFDCYLHIHQSGLKHPLILRLGQPRILTERFLRGELNLSLEDRVKNVVPYFTVKGRNLSFFYNLYEKDSFNVYKRIQKYHKFKFKKKEKNKIWIIGERPYKAQDNGYYFFKYMRENHPDLRVYYVIDKNSIEKRNVEKYGNVIYYKSPKHFDLITKADYICGTHHPDFLFPNRSKRFVKKIKAKRIFLQHGILGTKNISGFYNKNLRDFETDLFITSSNKEKNIVINDLNYNHDEVVVTGLARFDGLFKNDIKLKKQILIIPTWRDWLTDKIKFKDSEYLIRYNRLLNNTRLLSLKEKGIEIIFCPHPNMQPFIDLFDIPECITVIRQGERDVQELMKKSSLMITDYSSVGFDFSLLHKPVVYFQFDRDRFLGRYPSHLDLDNDLPGFISNDEMQIVKKIEEYSKNDFKMEEEYIQKADQFCSYRDENNSKRIYEAVISSKLKSRTLENIKHDILFLSIIKRFRRSKYYFPCMKLFYRAVKLLLPIKKNLVVLESGVGKQIGDSPKAIYDELCSKDNNYQFVWFYNGSSGNLPSNTIVVKRLSVKYYYYLARAQYWINNQNFPSYIKKRKKTVYLQTWHGTPLKKMLHDVNHFEGKDDDYVNRVTKSISNWDFLISPSPYATKCFKSAFKFKKEILEVGYPRNDIFYAEKDKQEEIVNQLRNQYNLPSNKKIILYAPTFRDDEVNKKNRHLFELKLDLDKMFRDLKNDYILLIRAHVIISNKLKIDPKYKEFAINVSNYPDIRDLYLLADVCITDYSSVMFDFANTRKPLLFYTYDLEHYKDNLRGFYIDFVKEAPGPLLFNTNEVVHSLNNLHKVKTEFNSKYNEFYSKYCSYETGKASKLVVEKVFGRK